MSRRLARFAAITTLLCSTSAWAAVPVYGYKVVQTYPHDTSAYTEGLFYKDGYLYESTGQNGHSGLRKVELQSGRTLQHYELPGQYFGEGIVDWKDRLVQLTWQSHVGFVYELADFKPLHDFGYPGEGWALTRDDKHIYMSDGTSVLRVLDPETLATIGKIEVTADGEPVNNLNELEWVDGEIYANVWLTHRIARIDPASGHVIGWIDLSGLLNAGQASRLPDPANDVLNGIAYDAKHHRLFVTGKCWPKVFEITLVARPAP